VSVRIELPISPYEWENMDKIGNTSWVCGYCEHKVASRISYYTGGHPQALARACPECNCLTLFTPEGESLPIAPPGSPVVNVPSELSDLHDEARHAAGAGAHTASVMVSRKMLMNIAVREGAPENQRFVQYVDYLEDEGFFSPKMRSFVTYIKDLGNEANHEIAPKTAEDAIAAIEFVGALLRHNYEVPSKVPSRQAAAPEE
jgi:hypothetical protein